MVKKKSKKYRKASHKALVLLLAVAVAVIVSGLIISIISLNKLHTAFTSLQKNFQKSFITAAQSGSANITISTTTSLTLSNQSMSFGSGRVNASCDWCGMDSNGITWGGYTNGSNTSNTSTSSGGIMHPCCTTFTIVTAGFLLENTGNTNLSIGYTCTGSTGSGQAAAANCSYEGFIGGSRAPGMGGLELRVSPQSDASLGSQVGESTGVADTVQSCRGGGTLFRDSNWNITNASDYSGSGGGVVNGTGGPGVYRPISSGGHYLCGNSSNFPLLPDNNQDAAVVDMNITIPSSAGIGQKSLNIVFNATSS